MPRLLRTSFVPIAKDKIGPLALNCIARLTGNPFYNDIAHYTNDIHTALTAYTPAAAIKNPLRQNGRADQWSARPLGVKRGG